MEHKDFVSQSQYFAQMRKGHKKCTVNQDGFSKCVVNINIKCILIGMHFLNNKFDQIKFDKDELFKFEICMCLNLLIASGVAQRRKMVLAFSRALSW
jgi:hypothetical protein